MFPAYYLRRANVTIGPFRVMNTNPTNPTNPPDYVSQSTERAGASGDGTAESQSLTIPVIAEQLVVDKQMVETGRVRISKRVLEEEQTIDVPLIREQYDVERVPVNQYVDAPPAVRQEGDVTIYPVLREVLVTEKRLMLVEEVRVTKRQSETTDVQHVTLRREEVTVERIERIEPNRERPV